MRSLRLALSGILLLAGPGLAFADLLPANKPIPEVIDHYIDAKLKEEGIKPAPQADDATFIRRVTLDLVGRIPTPEEVRAYTTSTDPDKRQKLVDRLLASPGFVRHQANEFDTMLTAGSSNRVSMRDYFLLALKEDRPWDQIFREVIKADDKDPKTKGASAFLKQRVKDIDRLTNDVSVVFFGVNVSCAQCHDHPLVHDWKQDHFFGMKSFFARTYEAGGGLGEREFGTIQFRTTKGVTKQATLMFLTGKMVEDPGAKLTPADIKKREQEEKAARDKKDPKAAPAPKFSTRSQLAELALQPDQRSFFAKSIANRLWHRFTGTGLVAPLDQMHSENAPSHPELLEWLARDVAENKYDLRRPIRGIVMSKTYSRSSKWDGETFPRPQTYAVARLKPLTPMQMATALRIATTAPDQFPATLKPDEFERKIEGIENGARGFASSIEQPRDDFQISVMEALLFSNSDRIDREFLTDGKDRLVGALKEMKDPEELARTLVVSILGRVPAPEEKAALIDYLKARSGKQGEAVKQMAWALLASPEFRFNH